MNIFKRAWTWLTTKSEETKVTDTTAASTEVEQPAIVDTGTEIAVETPAAEVKTGVNDFEAALAFVENGVEQLGDAAKEELKVLAKKYL
ncbi:hypothetical protein [Sodalis praecaptivus]|uniref:hypothetical protein n=1 Tax=Sodalis TaxID=84565 RepID=UPI00046CB7DD|nr:hypothetical protein [Sodalis praecaptivus]